MTQYSYSRVSLFEQCRQRFKFHYIDHVEIEEYPTEDDPLLLGGCMDTGIEHGFQAALDRYNETFPSNTQKKEWELAKLEHWINRLGPHFKGGEFQVKLENDYFLGYADWIGDGHLVDFKYASPKSVDRYRTSAQLHLYWNILTQKGYKLKDMSYVIIPKVYIRQKKDEAPKQFYDRLMETLADMEPIVVPVEYNPDYINKFGRSIENITMANLHDDFPPTVSKLCDYCPYNKICTAYTKS